MSENLKRAESLFNRIMNQNGMSGRTDSNSSSSKNITNVNYNHSNNSSHNNSSSHNASGQNNHSQSQNNHHSHSHHKSYKYNKASNYNNFNGQYNQPANIDLPKRDPLKLSQETVDDIPENHHILPYCWTIWHHSRSRPKQKELTNVSPEPTTEDANNDDSGQQAAAAVDSYLQTTNEIEFSTINGQKSSTKHIGSLEQLWMSMSSLKKTYELAIGTELLIFKSGINPVWEDPINTKGGRWVFRFNRRSNTSSNSSNINDNDTVLKVRQRTSLIWERLLMKTITGSIIPEGNYSEEIQDLLLNDICGLVLSVRKDEDIISIWNCNLNFNKKRVNPEEKDEEKKAQNKKLTSFQARRIICDSILRIIRECDLISQGSDCISTLDSGSNERVFGVSFEYRLHSDNNNPSIINNGGEGKYNRRFNKPYHNHHHNHSKNDSDN
ncbi:uncharacterized protein AC631_04500 [Debaryomyces fabryi]|uniref:Uncharacterized protein n=1 Tax=Debaryomyces fabryi TaxID=58627 RepID=A0A0V1PU44_9ASCO|nr:uncharacterized protein AC631_04500 [Debaryomyces fabryi]KRZ99733.1 hypothetical protein AC631_04500 [Debaryomyces fabryi]CUM54383.1 unnamed protein product [Debaryomyces fabryi]